MPNNSIKNADPVVSIETLKYEHQMVSTHYYDIIVFFCGTSK